MSLEKSLIETPMYDTEGHLAFPWVKKFSQIGEPTPSSALTYGTHAQRLRADKSIIPNGALWFETDTLLTYRMFYEPGTPAATWVQYGGILRRTQSQLAALVLGDGELVEVTDYRHVLRWNAATPGFEWGPGEDGRHDIVALPVDPDDTTGWQLCDGTVVNYLKGDGTLGTFATPDLVSSAVKAAYLKLGTPVSGPNVAVAPTITGHTSGPSAVVAVAAGSGFTVPDQSAVYDAVGTVGPSTGNMAVTATGEPRNLVLRPWFRK